MTVAFPSAQTMGPRRNLPFESLADFALYGDTTLLGANLRGANLRGQHLTDANLTYQDLTGADLTGATLTRAILDMAILTGANLTGANLTGANLASTNLDQAEWSDRTRWPTPAWTERMRVASDRLPDGRLRVRPEGLSDTAPVPI
ncbi:pentapeptide repeat-containing protein [[Actinomadura] parvosata]|uniref:pentapeptide repeat-containing protein n=1 Tax=[Actinomadura] parvosata TaxID=1955412 RepID=UPI001E592932|nr:pentapeptide repeat-containing protein [Nonomuraea sp. ATCC 55076]